MCRTPTGRGVTGRMSYPRPTMTLCPGTSASTRSAGCGGNNPAWRLLRAENAPLVLSFLNRVFVQGNARAVSAADLVALLNDELYAIRQCNPDSFPKSARAYLDDWAHPEAGWLREYYPPTRTSRTSTPPRPWKRRWGGCAHWVSASSSAPSHG